MIEEWLHAIAGIVVPAIELIAVLTIAAGTLECTVRGTVALARWPEHPEQIRTVWLRYSRWLIAGLTFQLAADIIGTSLAPGWEDIARLAAIAAIRTFLNYFLERDQREIREIRIGGREDLREAQ